MKFTPGWQLDPARNPAEVARRLSPTWTVGPSLLKVRGKPGPGRPHVLTATSGKRKVNVILDAAKGTGRLMVIQSPLMLALSVIPVVALATLGSAWFKSANIAGGSILGAGLGGGLGGALAGMFQLPARGQLRQVAALLSRRG